MEGFCLGSHSGPRGYGPGFPLRSSECSVEQSKVPSASLLKVLHIYILFIVSSFGLSHLSLSLLQELGSQSCLTIGWDVFFYFLILLIYFKIFIELLG